ncbi:Ribose import permease protein RbsC [subsurface metagenome]
MLKKGGRSRLSRYIDILGPWLGIILFAIVMTSLRPVFLTPANITNVLVDAAAYIVVAVGMTFVITGAGIDLSVGSILALSGIAMTWLIKYTPIDPMLAIVVCLAVGASLGLVNGLLITKLKMPDIVATLATAISYRGLALVIVGGRVLFSFPPALRYLGVTRLGAIVPVCIIMAILVVVAIGGNRTAAIHAGIPVDRYKIYTYIFSGLMAALAGVMIIGRLDSYHATFGAGMEFHTIAAVIIGGTALFGGAGRLWGSLAGALLIAMVINGLVAFGVNFYWQQIAIGIVLMLAVALYTVTGLRQLRGVGGGG